MTPLYLAAGASFVAGACGYIIYRFWLLPIGRFRKARRELGRAMEQMVQALESQDDKAAALKKLSRQVRRQALRLADCCRNEVPYWYRLVLVRRGHDPQGALEAAMKLEHADGQHRRHWLSEAGRLVGIDPFGRFAAKRATPKPKRR